MKVNKKLNFISTMKNIVLLLLISTACYSQTKRVPISEKEIGSLHCKHQLSINLDKGDTLNYIWIGFQNAKYSTITDTRSIMLPLKDSTDAKAFVKDLKAALAEMGSKADIAWTRDKYSINLYSFTDLLYLSEAGSKGTGYTMLKKSQVEELIAWLDKEL